MSILLIWAKPVKHHGREPDLITISRPMTMAIDRIATPLESERSVATSATINNIVTQPKR